MIKLQGPISGKVTVGSLTGAATGVVTWALTYFIPAWHHGIPAPLAPLIPVIVAAVGYFGGGYLAHHRATASELEAAIKDAETLLGLLGKVQAQTGAPPVRDSSPAGGAPSG